MSTRPAAKRPIPPLDMNLLVTLERAAVGRKRVVRHSG